MDCVFNDYSTGVNYCLAIIRGDTMSNEYSKLEMELDGINYQGSYHYMDLDELEKLEFELENALRIIKRELHTRAKFR